MGLILCTYSSHYRRVFPTYRENMGTVFTLSVFSVAALIIECSEVCNQHVLHAYIILNTTVSIEDFNTNTHI